MDGLTFVAMLLTSMLLCWPLLDELPEDPDEPPEYPGDCDCADGKVLAALVEFDPLSDPIV